MRELPAGWPDPDSPEQTTPVAFADFDGTWPPADGDAPAGTAALSSWSVDRQLRASSLAGQIRAATGFATADASCAFVPPAGGLIAPWLHGDRTVVPPSSGRIRLAHEGYDGDLVMGSFDVDPISSQLSAPEVTLDMIEGLVRLNRPQNLPAPGWLLTSSAPVGDAIWAVDHVARQAGFYSTPAPAKSCIGSLPMQGSNQPEIGFTVAAQTPSTRYEKHPDLGIVHSSSVVGDTQYLSFTNRNAPIIYVAVSFVGTVYLALRLTAWFQIAVKITDTGTFAVDTATNRPFATSATYAPGLDPNHPHRVVLAIDLSNPVSGTVRVRSSASAAWSSTLTQSTTTQGIADDLMIQTRDSGSYFNAVQVLTRVSDQPALFAPTNTDLELLGNPISSFWVEQGMTAREVIDGFVGASFGAVWVDVDGTLIVRDRRYLRGAAPTVEVIDVGDEFEDLQWKVDPAEAADRVEVIYEPASFIAETSPIFEARDPYYVGQGVPLEITVPIDAHIYGDPGIEWQANRKSDGTGTVATDDHLFVFISGRTMSTITITIQNLTNLSWYMVDDNGSPALTVSADAALRFAGAETIGVGVPAGEALRPLQVRAGTGIQSAAYARDLADFLLGITRYAGWRVERVKARFDPRRDIGDIVRLVAADYGLSVKAIVTGIHMSGRAGEVRQDLDLAVLPPTIYDFNEAWNAAETTPTIGDFNTRWAGLTVGDLNHDPLSTT